MNFDVIDLSTNITRKRILKRKAVNIFKEIKEIKEFVTKNMKNVQERQLNVLNAHRKDDKYEVEDLI